MRFIQVFNRYLQPGGEETSVGRIADHLEVGGHQVDRFWRASEEWTGVGAPARWRQGLLMWNNPGVLKDLRVLQERTGAEAWVMHNVLPVISLGVYRLARELGVPVIQWLHNYRPLSPGGGLSLGGRGLDPADRWLGWKEAWAGTWRGRMATAMLVAGYERMRWRGDWSAVAAWVAVSDGMRDVFLRGGWRSDRIFTVRHAWDCREVGVSEGVGDYFLFLGRMLDLKGVRFLVELWEDPELRDIPLVMAGEGPLREALEGRTGPAVRWTGYVVGEEKRALLRWARAVLFPCQWEEPLSTVAYEAYEHQRPMLSSDLGGMREVVMEGRTGRRLPAGDREAWKRAILDVWRQPDRAREWGREGRRWLEANVSAGAWNRAFQGVLERVIQDQVSGRVGEGGGELVRGSGR